MDSEADRHWMRQALRQATYSRGQTWPNPGVGCVIVGPDGQLLGSGRHRRCGGDHAEIIALAACRAAGHDPRGATAYVTLAPCTSTGRTGPCSTALIAAGLDRVVAAIPDPIQRSPSEAFASASISYACGVLAAEAEDLHGGFVSRVTRGRPRLTAKWAMTIDGFLATTSGYSAWISCPRALAFSRRRRRHFDAIVVAGGTVRADDPRLLAATAPQRGPWRVVVSATARLPDRAHLVYESASPPVVLIHDARAQADALVRLEQAGVRLHAVDNAHEPIQVGAALAALGFNDVLVEGGGQLHNAFLAADMYDSIECYIGPLTMGGGRPVASGDGVASVADGARWHLWQSPRRLGASLYCVYRRVR